MENLSAWIGRKQVITDRLTRETVKRFNVTVTDQKDVDVRQINGLHYTLGNEALPRDELGEDSHPAKGGFLPPVPLPRRMWAGSKVNFLAPLPVNEDIIKTSTIVDIASKKSRSGDLVFVTVDHTYQSDDEVMINESQTIVYREALPYKQTAPDELPDHIHSMSLVPDATLLFRYSALTFNGHRIHYDQQYVTEVEGYPGLVVHGPLIATLLMNLAQEKRPNDQLLSFEYRGNAPAFVNERLQFLSLDENCTELEARNADNALIMTGKTGFKE